jgi:hypothetical protein
MKRNVTLALVALLIGCGAGAAGHHVFVPPAGAQVAGKAFQHTCRELKWEQVLGDQELQSELGKAGWELATFVSAEEKGFGGTTTRIVACFKREVAR